MGKQKKSKRDGEIDSERQRGALPTQHVYYAGVSRRSATGNCELRTCPRSLPDLLICKYQAGQKWPVPHYVGGPQTGICCTVAENHGDACLLFGGQAGHLWPVQTPARRAIQTGQKWPLSNGKAYPYMSVRAGFEPVTLRSTDIKSTNAPSRPTCITRCSSRAPG